MDRIREACIGMVETTKACSLHTVELMTYLPTSRHVMMRTMHHNFARESDPKRILYGCILFQFLPNTLFRQTHVEPTI